MLIRNKYTNKAEDYAIPGFFVVSDYFISICINEVHFP